MTARRQPRATALEVTVNSGEHIRLTGRLAEVLACISVELASRPQYAQKEFWRLEVNVSQQKVVVSFLDTAEPWRFRDVFTA